MHVSQLADSDGSEANSGKAAVEMYCTDVLEDSHGGFVYVHKLRKGINRKSHALKVARLAGLPEAAIAMAREVLTAQQPNRNHLP